MLTDMGNWTEIRRRALVDGQSMRRLRGEFHLRWKTLRKILDHPEPPGYRRQRPRPRPKLGPFLQVLHRILEDDTKAPRKQGHTAKRVFERLRDERGHRGGLTAVEDAVRDWRRGHTEVFVPPAHPPGGAQVDFGEAEITLDCRPTEAASFVMTPPHCDAIFCRAFPRECTEAFLEGHVRAFDFFGGVPRRISHDNLRIAVAEITGGRGREVTDGSRRLQSHYRFGAHFCPVRRPDEKGHVETSVGYSRRNFLVPAPVVHGGLEPLNLRLATRCAEEVGRRLRGKPATKGESLGRERAAFLPSPAEAFVARRVKPARASSLSPVRFDTSDCSVPTAYAHRVVTVEAAVDVVRVAADDLTIAGHPRRWDRQQVTYDPIHYLALRERSPGAGLRGAAGGVGAAGLLRHPAEAAGGRARRVGDAAIHRGPAAAGAGRPRGADACGRAGPGAGRRRCRRGAPDPGASTGTAGRPVLPRRPPAPQGSGRARARPAGLREPQGGGDGMRKIETKSTVLLKHHLKALEPPTMTAGCEEAAARCAKENADHPGFLLQLCELELLERECRSAERRLEAAKLPAPKALDGSDFTAAPPVNKPRILELMGWDSVERRGNVILVGSSGTGESHLATALAASACGLGRRVRSFRVTEPATLRLEAREERQLTRLGSQPAKLDLLALDELGYVPASQVGAELLFDVIGRAYERSSVIVTTNSPFEEREEVPGSERSTGATLDRLTHRCTIIATGKESHRLKEARNRRRGAMKGGVKAEEPG